MKLYQRISKSDLRALVAKLDADVLRLRKELREKHPYTVGPERGRFGRFTS